jgi:hypothetical protein
LILHRVASPSLLNHGRVGLDRVRGHARSPAKPRELGVHDGAELARCCMPEDPASPVQARGGDTSWLVQHSTSGGLVLQYTNFSTLCCSSMA